MYRKLEQIRAIYKNVDGNRILKEYLRAGILGQVLFETALLGTDEKALEIVRVFAEYKIQKKLKKKYSYIKKKINKEKYDFLSHSQSDIIWFCWLQGLEKAPSIVQCCYQSLIDNISSKTVQIITYENIFEFVKFPDYIMEKWKDGYISNTHFSDLLRLELLIKYGGTWIDATVLCTGGYIPDFTLNSDLFLFQELKPGRDGHSIPISSWFITATSNQKLLIVTRELLYEYWKNKNYMVNYYLLHIFFCIACEWYPEEKKKIPEFSNSLPHMLLLKQFETFDEKIYNEITRLTPWHKLTYKLNSERIDLSDTFYSYVIKKYKYRNENRKVKHG